MEKSIDDRDYRKKLLRDVNGVLENRSWGDQEVNVLLHNLISDIDKGSEIQRNKKNELKQEIRIIPEKIKSEVKMEEANFDENSTDFDDDFKLMPKTDYRRKSLRSNPLPKPKKIKLKIKRSN